MSIIHVFHPTESEIVEVFGKAEFKERVRLEKIGKVTKTVDIEKFSFIFPENLLYF
jgi:hypothetical protein